MPRRRQPVRIEPQCDERDRRREHETDETTGVTGRNGHAPMVSAGRQPLNSTYVGSRYKFAEPAAAAAHMASVTVARSTSPITYGGIA